MRTSLALALLGSIFYTIVAMADRAPKVDWSQPPVACAEEVIPAAPSARCLDLSRTENPTKEFPADIDPGELAYWQANKKSLSYCRAQEVLRRERRSPGSMPANWLEIAFMQDLAVQESAAKVAAVYEASRYYKMPVQVLVGAIYQESLFAALGIADDGGNFSCGAGQVNVEEWCRWMNSLSDDYRSSVAWPKGQVNCSGLKKQYLAPFYELAKRRLGAGLEYRISKSHFEGIRQRDVDARLPVVSPKESQNRFQMIMSFVNACSEPRHGILAKAHELSSLYNRFVPEGMKRIGLYAKPDRFRRQCQERGFDSAYPLHTGWLLAVAMYNAGPRALDLLAHYNRLGAAQMQDPNVFRSIDPLRMVESFYWGGRYNSVTDQIDIVTLAGKQSSFSWFKTCVLQRHVARVVQHVTLPGLAPLVDTLEGEVKCAKSQTGPNGEIMTSVPERRQVSTGQISIQ